MLAVHIIVTDEWPWLFAMSATGLAIAFLPHAYRSLRIATGALAVADMILIAYPISAMAATIRMSDSTCAEAYGSTWSSRIPIAEQRQMRHSPFMLSDALLGIQFGMLEETRLSNDIPPGRSLAAIRYRMPSVTHPQPVIIAIHGGGWTGGSISEGSPCHRYLANHGYVVYSIDYRVDPETRFPGQLDDVLTAITWIFLHAASVGGDPTRIVLLGRSAGAELVLVAAYTLTRPSIRAVVSWYGPVDLVSGYRVPPHPDPLDVRTLIQNYVGGTPDTEPELFARASPISYATHPLPTTLLIAGCADHVVLIESQRRMRDQPAATGTTVALIEIPWAEHVFDRIASGPGAQLSLYYLERFLWCATAP